MCELGIDAPISTDKDFIMHPSSFVFLDDRPWPYLVNQQTNGDWWLYYWADSQKNFVTLRKLEPHEVERFKPFALPKVKADLYLNNYRKACTLAGMPLG